MADWDPRPDFDAAALLGNVLRELSYDEESIEGLLGDDGTAPDRTDSVVFARRLPDGELPDAIRLLLLQLPVAEDDAAAALGRDGVEALHRIGFVTREGDELVPRARIVPTEGVYLAYDGFSQGLDDPAGWVASFTPTAYWLASLTVHRDVERALDVGTGNGAHALFAAGRSGSVVATDVNLRALVFTALGAALNGIDNVSVRSGSLFEPVAGEAFDLITCNAPYVISPENRWQYRDAGARGDEFSEQVVRQAARHLRDGGYASLVVSWLGESEEDPDAHVHEWLEGSGCDAWLLGLRGADPLDHASGWNEHLAGDPRELAQAIDRWEAYFESLGAGWITEGVVVLHKRPGGGPFRADAIDEDDLEGASDQIERVFEVLAAGPAWERRVRLVDDVRFDEELDRDGRVASTVAILETGTWPSVEIDPEAVDVLISLDGGTTLREAAERMQHEELQELLELGFLELL